MSSTNRILFLTIVCLVLSHELEVCIAHPTERALGAFLGADIDCKLKCDQRCHIASRYRRCFRACMTCCQRCNCVPAGHVGNEGCPCWNTITTIGGRKKCP